MKIRSFLRWLAILVLFTLLFLPFTLKKPTLVKSYIYQIAYLSAVHLREKIAGLFVFGNYDEANWHLILAEKRIAEAEKMLKWGSLNSYQDYWTESGKEITLAEEYLSRASSSGEDVNYLKQKTEDIKRKQNEIND